eukprot:CAMPEP_0116072714 /NCGR_PEP_ID=MMETSP0322-20121206/14721_1 /TAXON_ID=163516 /ORGANISM="Leptocylindrus danicus var. apora, Strain B651" /LENGTH=397 /DNA_ID=CAMNT_0003561669 /DNA_START=114 /DNA_END=1307 /DNA_ORIENTATION=-
MFSVQRLFIKRFQLARHSYIATGRLTVNEGHPFRGAVAWRKDYLDGSGSSSARYLSSSSSSSSSSSRSMSSMSTNNSTIAPSLIGTPFASNPEAARLLDGLDVHSIPADGDGHLLTVYSKAGEEMKKRPIVLLHGRTWSSVPVYHLSDRSIMEAFRAADLEPYAIDFRGFGGTARDITGKVVPHRCVNDTETVLKWVAERHGLRDHKEKLEMPALLGWSQGALVAQLVAQKSPRLLSKLILYGSIYDPLVRYPRAPLYTKGNANDKADSVIQNEYDAAIEDFTIEGSIAPEQADSFAEAALLTDPEKAMWTRLDEFNNCDPARVNVPTLVIAGDQDPYAPLRVQAELFTNLGRGADRSWSIIADADHAVHLLEGRGRFLEIVTNFVENGVKGGTTPF